VQLQHPGKRKNVGARRREAGTVSNVNGMVSGTRATAPIPLKSQALNHRFIPRILRFVAFRFLSIRPKQIIHPSIID
jgi:hypothetical protein